MPASSIRPSLAGPASAPANTANTTATSGITLVLLAVLGFSLLDVSVKYASVFAPLLMVVWTRYLVQAVLMGAWLARTTGPRAFRTARPGFQLIRGVLLLLTSIFAYLGLKAMPIAEFTSVAMLTPVIVTMLSPFALGEQVSARRWMLVGLAFCGGLLVLRPGSEVFNAGAIYPLLLACLSASFHLITRRMAGVEAPLTTHFYTGFVGTMIITVALPFSSEPLWHIATHLQPSHIALMLVAGVLGTLGHLAFIRAVASAPMSTLMPFTYAQIAFATILGALVFNHMPDWQAVAGMVVIAASGALSVWFNVPRGRERNVVAADTAIGD